MLDGIIMAIKEADIPKADWFGFPGEFWFAEFATAHCKEKSSANEVCGMVVGIVDDSAARHAKHSLEKLGCDGFLAIDHWRVPLHCSEKVVKLLLVPWFQSNSNSADVSYRSVKGTPPKTVPVQR